MGGGPLDRYRAAVAQLADGSVPPRRRHTDLLAALGGLRELSVSLRVEANLQILTELFAGAADVVIRRFRVAGHRPAALVFVDGMLSDDTLTAAVLTPLTNCTLPNGPEARQLATAIREAVVAAGDVRTAATIGAVVDAVLAGAAVVLVDGAVGALEVRIPEARARAIEEPVAETTIRGPREGLIEHLTTNTALLRRRLRTPFLKIETLEVGRASRTQVALVYLQDVADPALVSEARRRLRRIDIDAVLDAGYIEELIEDNVSSLFPQIQNTERPDTVAANLAEGRVAILVDNSPFALILPVTIWSFFSAGEDYYERFAIAAFLRMLRVVFAIIALLGPATWVAIISFHQELLPTSLLLTVASAREGIPFPAVVETLVMEIFFEALREAGVRLPRPVGQAVSIVGALVIGQAAVQAGLISAPKVIVVAATGIASFTIPRFNFGIALRLLRFAMILLAGSLGLFGIILGLLFLLFHLAALRSFGVPYLQPLAPLTVSDLKDTMVRLPRWLLDRRPEAIEVLDRRRAAPWLRPRPPGGGQAP